MKHFSFKRAGGFCFAFLPFIICTGIQNVADLFMMEAGIFGSALFGNSDNFYSTFFTNMLSDNGFSTMVMIVYSLMSICLYGLWYYCRCGGEFGMKAVRQFHVLRFAGVALLVPGLQLMSSIICNVIYFTVPAWIEAYEELLESAGVDDRALLTILYSVIFAPVAEELIFRGVTLRLFRRVCPHFMAANFMQALLFGIFHGNWVQGIYAFCLGLVLGYVCEKGGTIYYSMFLHFLFNFWGMVLSIWIDETQMSDALLIVLYIGYTLLFVLGAFLFLMSFRCAPGYRKQAA